MKTIHPKPYKITGRFTFNFGETGMSFDGVMCEVVCFAKLYSAEISVTYHGITVLVDPGSSLDSARRAYAAALRN